MNFFHLSIGHISRSTGRSTVQNVAYITGEILYEDRRGGKKADYANNRGKTTWETMAPLGSGIASDDLSFWNKLENFEDAYARKRFKNPATLEKYLAHARTGHTYETSLPKELTKEQNIELVRDIVLDRFVSKGLLATYAINWNEGNPHVHITVSSRTVWNGEISWDKSVARHLTSQREFRESRRIFAGFINKHQELAGISDRVDWRSYAELGIGLIPGYHKGYEAHRLEKEGLFSRIAAENAQISEENRERIAEVPSIILKELTSKQATFSERDVVRLVLNRMKDDVGVLSQHVIYSVLREAVEVGIGFDDQKRYTSKAYKAKEDHILESLEVYKEQTAAISILQSRVEELLAGEASWLNEGQKEAVRILCGNAKFSGLIGRAGTGKTTALQYVVKVHQEAGYTIWGMAPSATAAHELRKGAGCESDTIAHYAYYWKPYFEVQEKLEAATTEEERSLYEAKVKEYKKHLPDKHTLILVDEIGMVGVGGANNDIAGGWDALIKIVNLTGAKFMVVGDDHQAKPIESGDITRKVFRDFKDTSNLCVLTEIQRQRLPWMREASLHLAELRTSEALGMYENQGHIQSYETNGDVYQNMARQYLRNLVAQPDSETLAMAYTNEEVRELNGAIRKILKENGLLVQEDLLTRRKRVEKSIEQGGWGDRSEADTEKSIQGEKGAKNEGAKEGGGKTSKEALIKEMTATEGYTVGDKIVFTLNDRGFWTKFDKSDPTFFVRNGMQGHIESIKPCRMKERGTDKLCDTYKISVRVEEGKQSTPVSFYLREYSHFQHGYAVTVHKTQGATGDGSLVKLSRYMDAYTLYVAMTRHREDISITYSQEDFADFHDLLKTLGKISVKDLAADYSILEENMDFWSNVQEYKALGFELLSIRAFARHACARHACAKSGDKADKEEQEKTRVSEAWTMVRKLEEERKGLAKLILEDWDVHGDFVRQAGITFETLEFAAGLKNRPLSRREQQAQLVVEQYASIAIETRQVWRNIRRTHPGARAKMHPEWESFEALRNQRGVLANRIIQDPVLYRPFLKAAGKVFEEGGNSNFGYGLHIIKAQSEAHQSKMLQQEMLNNTSDPVLSEKLKAILEYVEARDLSASLWKDLKPKLKQVEGTLLSEGFCNEIDEWKEVRMTRDQHALKIVDSWEGYGPLIRQVGMKLSFETLMDQKEQAIRDMLLKTYTTSQEDTRLGETAKFHAAFELKMLMDEEATSGKKITVAQVYQQGLQPKDVARHALEYQKLKVFESLSTEPERQLFLLLDGYDDKCREANRLYVVCLNEIKEMNENVAEEAKGKESTELKPWDSPSWPAYQEACKPRNKLALEIFDRSNHGEVLALADAMGLKLKEVELEQIFLRGERAFRDSHIEKYLTSLDQEEKGGSAFALLNLINSETRVPTARVSEQKQSKRDSYRDEKGGEQRDAKGGSTGDRPSIGGRPSTTAKQAYHAGIDFKELRQVANTYKQSHVLQKLNTEEEVKTFHALQSYEKATHLANQAYKSCIEEAKNKSLKAWEMESFKIYIPLAAAQNQIARILFEDHNVDQVLDLARKMGMSLDVSKFITQVENGMRDFHLETFKTTTSGLVKAVSAAEIYGLLEADERQGSKKTFGALKGKEIPVSDIRDYAYQFNRLTVIESLSTEAEKEQFRLYSAYDYHAVIAKGIYRQCVDTCVADTPVPGQENLGIKPSESKHFPAYREEVSERNAAALTLSKHPDFLGCLDLAERQGLSVNRELILSHAEDGYREKLLKQYKELAQSPDTESEILKVELAERLVRMIQDDQAEGHKRTLLALYQAEINPKVIFAEANDFKDYMQFTALETEEERHLFGLVYAYKMRSARANEIYRQCAAELRVDSQSKVDPRREKLQVKVSDNPLYPEYLAAVSARNESATALLGSPDWEGCLLLAEQLGVEIDEDKVIAQSRDGQRKILLDQYIHTDSILVKRLIARELKEGMVQDQKEQTRLGQAHLGQGSLGGQKVTVADLYRRNLFPRDIQEEAKQFDRMTVYANLSSDADKQTFSLLVHYDTLVTQSKRHYGASFQEAEEQGIKKEETASYALFQEVLKERQEMASVIQQAIKPSLIASIAEEIGVSLQTLNKDCRNYEISLADGWVLTPPQPQDPSQEQHQPEVVIKEDQGLPQLHLGTSKTDLTPENLGKTDLHIRKGESAIDRESTIDLAAERFVSLSEKYEKTHWRAPEKNEIRGVLDKLVSTYWQNERFVTQIKNSGSVVGVSKIKIEIHLMETEFSRNRYQVDGLSAQEGTGSTGAASASLAKVEMAAKEFVSLIERYEKAHWKDPERNAIRASLDKIVSTHWQDERFVSKIENSGNEVAASKIKIEIHLMETELSRSRRELDR